MMPIKPNETMMTTQKRESGSGTSLGLMRIGIEPPYEQPLTTLP
jgi:hypothetical protein